MGEAQILIKFTGPSAAGNVTSALALSPELMIPVEYGRGMTEKERGRLNYYFHKKNLPTIVTEPLLLDRYMEADMETKLERLFEKYRDRKPVVDISDADAPQAMATGAVLARHQYWAIAVLDARPREQLFLPLKNAAHLRRLAFPRMTEEDFRFLERSGADPDRDRVLSRADLTRETASRIRMLGRFYAESPVYWRDISSRFHYAAKEAGEPRREYILDARALGIKDSVFEDLRDIGVLDLYERKGGIVRYRFTNDAAQGMLTHISDILLINVFLLAAQIREYGKKAALADLALYDYSYVCGILRSSPLIFRVYEETKGTAQLYELRALSSELYGGCARKILVCYTETGPDEEFRSAAADLDVELIAAKELTAKLEPR